MVFLSPSISCQEDVDGFIELVEGLYSENGLPMSEALLHQ